MVLVLMKVCGGVGDVKQATVEVQQLADSVKPLVEQSVASHKKDKLHPYKAVSYKSQVVAGVNYFIKVEIDGGKEYLHLRVFRPLGDDSKPVLSRHQESHSQESELSYF